MISFFFAVIGLIIILCVIHAVFIKDNESFIPTSISNSDLWQDGETLKYYYHGRWYEAVAKDKNKVYIYDETKGEVIGVPFRKDI